MGKIAIRAALIALFAGLLTSVSPVSAATLACTKGTSVKTVSGKSTMLYKGKRVACTKPVATPKPSYPVPAANPQVRFAANAMNDLVIRAGLTVTIRNTESTPRTLVISELGISVTTPGNDISAFLAPTKVGIYQMTTLENPNTKATLTVVP